MSDDYFLVSPQNRKAANVGSVGLSGVQSYPGHPDVVSFVRWAIEANVKDVRLISEGELVVLMGGDEEWPAPSTPDTFGETL